MDSPSGSVHRIRFFDHYDSYGNKFRGCICAIPVIFPQIDVKYCVASPTNRKIFSVIAQLFPEFPDLPNGQFYMLIRRKKEMIVDGMIPGLGQEYAFDEHGFIPSTIRTTQEVGLDDEDVPCYDTLNFKLLKKQGIIRVLEKVYRDETIKILRVEMLLKADEMIRWCDSCARVEDIKNLTERYTACEGCSDYQKYYFCSDYCQEAASRKFSPHNELCGEFGKSIKKFSRGDFFVLQSEDSEPKDEIYRLILPSYYYGLEPLEIL